MLAYSHYFKKQPHRGVLWKRCSENMQQIYRRTHMLKYDFNKVALPLLPKNFSDSFKGFSRSPCLPTVFINMFLFCPFDSSSY